MPANQYDWYFVTFFQCTQCSLFPSFLGVKFAPSTKEFTVAIPGKGHAVFNMEKKVANPHKRCYDIILVFRNAVY